MIESVSLYAEAETKSAGSSAFCRTTTILQGQPLEGKPTGYSGCATAGVDVCQLVLWWGSKELPSC
jgi:hypothetical protein